MPSGDGDGGTGGTGLLSPGITPEIGSFAGTTEKKRLSEGKRIHSPVISSRVSVPDTDLQESDKLSVPEACFNLTNTVVGVGVLSVPYSFKLGGYCTILSLAFVIAITSQTGKFIGRCLLLAEKSPEFDDTPYRARDMGYLATVALGPRGKTLVNVVTVLEVWCALCTFLVMNGINSHVLHDGIAPELGVLISCAVMVVTVFIPLRIFSYFALVASVAIVLASVALMGAAWTLPEWGHPWRHLGTPALVQWSHIPQSVGLLVFCFAGHPCFPMVHESMEDKRRWSNTIGLTFGFAFVYYGGMGIFGYLVFGDRTAESFALNLDNLPEAQVWSIISVISFLIKIQLTAPLLFNVIFTAVYPEPGRGSRWPWQRVVTFIGVVLVTLLVSMAFADKVYLLASFTGSLFTMGTSVIFPTYLHLRLLKRFGTEAERAATPMVHWVIICWGIVMAVFGTVLNVAGVFAKDLY